MKFFSISENTAQLQTEIDMSNLIINSECSLHSIICVISAKDKKIII